MQKPWKSNRILVDTQRPMPTMQKVQNTKMVNPVKTSQVQHIDEIVKDPSEHAEVQMMQMMLKEQKRNTRIPCVCQQTQSTSVDTTPNCTRAGHTPLAQVEGICGAHFSALFSISFVMLLDCPPGRFLPITSSPTCSLSRPSASSTSLGRSRVNPCVSAHWSGMSLLFGQSDSTHRL